ncbi:MAG: hypothetical protein N2486_06715 [Caloramator sp.]|nr:hypothetical protein [Caloramator sp.]
MRLLDNKIYLENDELRRIFYVKDEEKEIPYYIQDAIVDLIFKEWGLKRKYNNLNDLELIEDEFVEKVINIIDNLYKVPSKTDYSDKHITYIWYYLPNNMYKIWQPLIDLLIAGELKNEIRLLDIGTGPATLPLGIIEFYKIIAENLKDKEFILHFDLIDSQKKFIDYANYLINKALLPNNLKVEVKSYVVNLKDDSIIKKDFKYDIISISNFINHFEHKKHFDAFKFLKNLGDNLNEDGSLIIIEPGSKFECISLKKIRNKLINEGVYNIFSPCVPVWEERDEINCACFSTYIMKIKKPKIIDFLISKGLRKSKKREHVSYNYIVLRRDGLIKYSIEKNKQSFYTFKEIFEKQEKEFRVNVKGIVKKKSKKNLSFCICDGTIPDKDYWIKIDDTASNITKEAINKLNMGEKVSIKKMKIVKQENVVNMILDLNSEIKLFF